MRAFIVCVDYSDLLAITLPYNRHHFDDVFVITTPDDLETLSVSINNNARTFVTSSFYEDGAEFNKFRALQECIDSQRQSGLICVMDADVLWPKKINQQYEKGYLYTPLRRMKRDLSVGSTREEHWKSYPLHHLTTHWSGYTQIFHAEDQVLGRKWFDVNWRHAGNGDTTFQNKWVTVHEDKRRRPDWECLHLGEPKMNWCGRVSPMVDGSIPEEAKERAEKLENIFTLRRTHGSIQHEELKH